MTPIELLVAVRRDHAARYHKNLSAHKNFRTQIFSDVRDVQDKLAEQNKPADVLVVDNGLAGVIDLIEEVRHSHPRLFVVLVDEDVDFGMPGYADDMSTNPFVDDDLIRRITRLMSDRQLETLRADSLPTVRQFAKELRNTPGEIGKQQVTVSACKNLGYDYVAFYRMENTETATLSLRAQNGPAQIQATAPKTASPDDLISWAFQHGESRVAGPEDTPSHILVSKGQLGTVACIPVLFSGTRYGVLAAFRSEIGSITPENVMELELMVAQLGSAISKELIG